MGKINKEKYKRFGKFYIFSQFTTFRGLFRDFMFSRKQKYKRKVLLRELRFFKQRFIRGWDDSETWNLDCELSEFLYPRAKRLFEIKDEIHAPPYDNDLERELTEGEWDIRKKKILFYLNETRLENSFKYTGDNKEKDRYISEIEEGKYLLFKHLKNLWW